MIEMMHLNVEITHRCNQNCFYCMNCSSEVGSHTPHSAARWLSLLSDLRPRGLKSLLLTGGEPFLWPEAIDLLRGAQNLGLETSVLTNGYRIPELVQMEREVFSQLNVVQVSLDSASEHQHDIRRGTPGAWRQSMGAIESLRRHSIPIEVSAVIDDHNADQILPLASFCHRIEARLILRGISVRGRATSAHKHAGSLMPDKIPDAILAARLYPGVLTNDRFGYVEPLHLPGSSAVWLNSTTIDPNGGLVAGDGHWPREVARHVATSLRAA